jgi:formamidopyrimidine-DNA glycosylase
MPELPEVETVRIGLSSKLEGVVIQSVVLRRLTLRWPIPQTIVQLLPGKKILKIRRRAKYLLIDLACGSIVIHLGMSGCLKVVDHDAILGKHDHVDIFLDNNKILRYSDPRRFGSILWQPCNETHVLLSRLGMEPLSCDFSGDYLFKCSRKRTAPIKAFLMNQHVVVGIGNIYAAEALFESGIAPGLEVSQVSYSQCVNLVNTIKTILTNAIVCGGTTFRDFVSSDGQIGNFKQYLAVYGRCGKPCLKCGNHLSNIKIVGRSTIWCRFCQS